MSRRELLVAAVAAPLAIVGAFLLSAGLAGWVSWLEGGATLLGGFILGLLGIGLATWLIPRAQVARWREAGVTDPIKLAELTNTTRTTITQAAAGVGLILTLALTAYQVNETRRSSDANLRIAEQGQVTERFARAVEQLGATTSDGKPAIDIRIGGLFSLLRIGLDSERDRLPALLVAAEYVKNNHRPSRGAAPGHACLGSRSRPRADVAAALEHVLPRLAEEFNLDPTGPYPFRLDHLDLSSSDLRAVNFRNVRLEHVSFRNSILTGSSFEGVFLLNVDFRAACLLAADLRGAGGIAIDFRDAEMTGAKVGAALLEAPRTRGLPREELRESSGG